MRFSGLVVNFLFLDRRCLNKPAASPIGFYITIITPIHRATNAAITLSSTRPSNLAAAPSTPVAAAFSSLPLPLPVASVSLALALKLPPVVLASPSPNPPMISPPSPLLVLAVVLSLEPARGIVFDPTIKELALFRDTYVPEMVVPGAPGVSVDPAIARPVGAAVITWEPMVVVRGLAVGVEVRVMVWELRMSWLAVFRDTSVPSIVIPIAPGVSVDPPIWTFVGLAVMVWLPMAVTNNCSVGVGSGMVLDPMRKAEDPREIGVPDTVIAGASGVSVVPAIETPL